MKKSFAIITIIGLCFAGISALFVFMPATLGTGLIGTYLPSKNNDNPFFSSFTLKANNIVRLTYSENNKTAEYRWYAKCDGTNTSIYFVFSETSEIQFNLVSTQTLKDIYHNDDIYYKK